MNYSAAFRKLLTAFVGNLMLLMASHSKYSHSFQPAVVTSGVDSCFGRRRSIPYPSNHRLGFCITGLRMSDSDSEIENISIPFDGSEDRFDRWKFLQDLLDGDQPFSVVNIVLYRVLEGVLKFPRPSGGGDTLGSDDTIEMTTDVKETIKEILADHSTEGRVNALMTIISDDEDFREKEKVLLATLGKLEDILPDMLEDEEGHKSLWDTVIELYGREAVKYHESQKPVSLDWKIASTVTRVLLHYDFLTYGIIDAPLIGR